MPSKAIIICLVLLLAVVKQSLAQDQLGVNPPSLKWSKMTTPAGDFIYPRGLDSTALQLAYRINSAYLLDSAEVLYNKRSKRITTILQNQSVLPEGYATTVPWRQEFYLASPQNLFMGPSVWRDGLATHEYRHAQQFMATKKGWTNLYMGIMGYTGWLFSTVINVPLWYREGDAVDSETRFTTGGRGTLPAFNMEYRTLRLNGVKYSYEKAMSASNFKDFVPNMYRSGYYMTTRLRSTHGDDVWARVLDQSSKRFVHPFSRALKEIAGEKTPIYYNSTFQWLDSIWISTDTVQKVVGTKISIDNNVFEKYRFPQLDNHGNLIVSYTSLREIRTFKELQPDSKSKKIKTAGIYSTDHENFVAEGELMTWAESAFNPRYLNKTFSVIKYKNLATGKIKQISHRSKYFSPAPSPDATTIAVVEFDEMEQCAIKLLDIETEKVTKEFSYHNQFLTQPRWINNQEIVLITVSITGNQLLKLNTVNGQWTLLLDALDVNIGKPYGYNGEIYFSSGLSGVENIYKLNEKNQSITQVTNARFGAFDPFVHQDTLYFSNYDKNGYEIWQLPLSSGINKTVKFPTAPVTDSKPNYYRDDVKDKVNASVKIDSTYNKFFWNKLFALTGWFPAVFPPELGVEFYTLNMQRTIKSTFGVTYNFNEDIVQSKFGASYAKFFPIINVNALSQARKLTQSFSNYYPDSLMENRTRETIYGAGLEIPLILTQGVYNSKLNIKSDFNYHQINELQAPKTFYNFNSIATSIEFSRIRPQARRQTQSPFAQIIQAHYKHGLDAGSAIQYFANGQFFFPSFIKTHSLNCRGAYQKDENSQTYRYLSLFRTSRGYNAYPFDETYLLSANYEMPIWYPDLYLRGILGITRVRINAFYDYAVGNTSDFEQHQRSYGGELILDLRVLRAFNMDFKLQFIQRVDYAGNQKPFMFNIGVDYFELLN